MKNRFVCQQATEGGSGGGSPTPAAATSMLDTVNSVIAEIDGGQAPASENPPAPAAPAAPAAAAPAGSAKPDVPPTAPPAPAAPVPYTDAELAAFEGEYDRRDFDWNRVPKELAPRLKLLESGTGKYRTRLEAKIRAELNQPTPAAQPSGQPAATPPAPANLAEAWGKFVNAETPEAGLSALSAVLATEQGRTALANLGYTDPRERAVVSELVQDRAIQEGLLGATELFPNLLKDEKFLGEVRERIGSSPDALKALQSRNPEEARGAFLVASALVVADRQAARDGEFVTREKALADRENAFKAKEADLQKQIEAANRTETVQGGAAKGGGGQASGAAKKNSLMDDVLEVGTKAGMFAR